MTVEVKQDRVGAVVLAIEMLKHRAVFVGIPAEFAQRDDDAPISNAQIGYINEFGSRASNIPPRPHLVPGIRAYVPQAQLRLKKALVAACDSSLTAPPPSEDVRKPQPSLTQIQSEARRAKPLDPVLKQLNAIGVEAVVSIKKQITDGLSPPLAEATIAARKRERFKKIIKPGQNYSAHRIGTAIVQVELVTPTSPLIDTGDYVRHINYVIRKV